MANNSKALLNAYCQERHLQLPVYSTQPARGKPGYDSSVQVSGHYASQAAHLSRNLAEEDAARVAYNSLRQASHSASGRTFEHESRSAGHRAGEGYGVDYSQKLERLCNARDLPAPEYDVRESSDGKFVATVVIGNNEYSSGKFESGAQAKNNAALIALAEVGLMLLNINEREDGEHCRTMHGIAALNLSSTCPQSRVLYQHRVCMFCTLDFYSATIISALKYRFGLISNQ